VPEQLLVKSQTSGHLLSQINSTRVTLPNIKNPNNLKKYKVHRTIQHSPRSSSEDEEKKAYASDTIQALKKSLIDRDAMPSVISKQKNH
jgi:hypothetical protein